MQQDQEIYEQTLKDKLTLGPVDKYEKYGRFPWKYILQLLLIIGTSYQGQDFYINIQVRILTQYNSLDSRNLIYVINSQIFKYPDLDYVYYTDTSPQNNFAMFYSLPDYFENIQQLFTVMGTLDQIFFTELNQTRVNLTQNTLKVYYRNPLDLQFDNSSVYEFTIQDGISNPFDLDNATTMKTFLKQVAKFQLLFKNIEFQTPDKRGLNLIESWTVSMTYTITDLQTMIAQLDARMLEINTIDGSTPDLPFKYSYYWMIHLIVLMMAMFSLLLHLKYLFDMVTLYTQTKFKSTRYVVQRQQSVSISQDDEAWEQQYINPEQEWIDQFDMRGHKKITKIIQTQKPWNMLTLDEKLLFLDAWVFVTIIGNLLQGFTSLVLIFNLQNLSFETIQLLMGFSCFFAWMAICRYIEYQENVYILTYLLKYSLPTLLRFILGVLPFFVGYAILGLTLFYKVLYFANFQRAFVSLICLSYGNMIYELAFFLGENFLATVFVLTYSVIFLIVFQNILMTIFVVMVYDKFDARLKQDMFDYLQTRIPNLHELLMASQKDKLKVSLKGTKTSPNSSPYQTPISNEYPVFLKNVLVTKIKMMSKKIEKSIQRMAADLNDDLKIFLITKKNDKQYVKQRNEVCLEYLIQKSQYIIRRSEKIKNKLSRQQ